MYSAFLYPLSNGQMYTKIVSLFCGEYMEFNGIGLDLVFKGLHAEGK